DHAKAVLEEVLGLDVERTGDLLDHLVRRNRTVPVHEVVEIPGREPGLRRERAIGNPLLVHQPYERRAERLLAEPSPTGHSHHHVFQGHAHLLSARTVAYVPCSVFDRLLPDGDSHWAADEIGVGELLPRPEVPIVEQDRAAFRLELLLELGRLILEA